MEGLEGAGEGFAGSLVQGQQRDEMTLAWDRSDALDLHLVGEDFFTRTAGRVVGGDLDHDLVQVLHDVLELL